MAVPLRDSFGLGGETALRLGFREIKGFKEADAERLTGVRTSPFTSVIDLWRRTALAKAPLEKLARADAFASLGLGRRQALWAIRGLDDAPLPLFEAARETGEIRREPAVELPPMSLGEQVADDYRTLRLSLKAHPTALIRGELAGLGYRPAAELETAAKDSRIRLAGLVTARQRPGSAKGVTFVTMEDETAIANLIVWADVFERCRRAALGAGLLGVEGRVQREGLVIHVVCERLFDLTPLLSRLDGAETAASPGTRPIRAASRDFH